MIAAYLRISTEAQADKHGSDSQRYAIERWADFEGIGRAGLEWFEDAGISGATMKRPGWESMMAGVRAGRFDTVVVHALTRAGRTTRGLLEWLEEMERRSVRLVFVTERIDTSTPVGKFLFTIVAAFGELERAITSERIRAGARALKASGKPFGKLGVTGFGGRRAKVNRHGTSEGMLKVTDDQLRACSHLGTTRAAAVLGISASQCRRRRARL